MPRSVIANKAAISTENAGNQRVFGFALANETGGNCRWNERRNL
jgi:hypothetical protein